MSTPINNVDESESDQSESMGRSDDGKPSKSADGSEGGDWRDADFLSFDNVANGGEAAKGEAPQRNNGKGSSNGKGGNFGKYGAASNGFQNIGQANNENSSKKCIPWLDSKTLFSQQRQWQQQQQQYPQQHQRYGNQNQGRGYSNYNDNNYSSNYGNNYNSNFNYNSRYGSIQNNNYGNNYNQSYRSPPPSPLIQLHNEMVSFVDLMKPTKEELKSRDIMVERVTKLAHRVFGGEDKCKVLPFGSQVTGLCLPNSDIDFVIRFLDNDTTSKSKSKSSKESKAPSSAKPGSNDEEEDFTSSTKNPLHRFAEAVREEFGVRSEFDLDSADNEENNGSTNKEDENAKEELIYLELIEQTRVPLVKFTVAPYNIDIDVCFDQPGGPESADLMHKYMEAMPPLKPLTFVLKYFLASREINKPFTGGIGSYLLQLMIVSFLQQRAREDKQNGTLGRHYNLGSLLMDFLELYGTDFNYVTTGLSVRMDGFYFPKGDRKYKNSFWQPSRPFSLAVENPLDVSMDVGAGAYRIQMIQRIFDHAFKTLLAHVSEPYEEAESILATIIPPTEEMEKRMVLKKVAEIEEAAGLANTSDDGEDSNEDRRDRKKSKFSPRKRKPDRQGSYGSEGSKRNRKRR